MIFDVFTQFADFDQVFNRVFQLATVFSVVACTPVVSAEFAIVGYEILFDFPWRMDTGIGELNVKTFLEYPFSGRVKWEILWVPSFQSSTSSLFSSFFLFSG
jgi:hypothetical protein